MFCTNKNINVKFLELSDSLIPLWNVLENVCLMLPESNTCNFLCYIIKEWLFYFNHFSLIIFYHSVWLGFELFGLRVQVCSQLVQFTLTCKGYDNHHCYNKPQTGNRTGAWMISCPDEMGWEFGRFWKRFSWGQTMVLRSWGPTMKLRN